MRVGYYENEVFQEGAQEGAVKTGYAYEYYQKISEYTGWCYDERKKIADQLKKDYEDSYNKSGESPWLRYSAAVGMAGRAFEDASAEFVFKRADEAMYKDKAQFKSKYGVQSR